MELADVLLSILWWYVQMGLVVDISEGSSQIAAPVSKIFESLLKSRDEVGDLSVEISPLGYLPTHPGATLVWPERAPAAQKPAKEPLEGKTVNPFVPPCGAARCWFLRFYPLICPLLFDHSCLYTEKLLKIRFR